MTSLIHSLEQLQVFDKVCQKVLSPDDCNALIVNFNSRYKYTQDFRDKRHVTDTSFKMIPDVFFAKQLYVADKSELNMIISTVNLNAYERFPKDSLSVYITFNPRNQVLALHSYYNSVMTKALSDQLPFDGNVSKLLINHIHKPEFAVKTFIEIDVDTKDVEMINSFIATIKEPNFVNNAEFIITTRNGYHIVFLKSKFNNMNNKLIYETCSKAFTYEDVSRDGKQLPKQPYFTIRSDVCFPIPGTYQGGDYPVVMLLPSEFTEVLRNRSIEEK